MIEKSAELKKLFEEKAAKIEHLQSPTEKNATIRHAIITGETGEYGGWQKNSRKICLQSFGYDIG